MATSNAFRSATNARESSDEIVTLIWIDHPDLDPGLWPNGIRIVGAADPVISGGITYQPVSLKVPWPDQDADKPPRIRVEIASERTVREALLAITDAATVTMSDVLVSQPEIIDLGPLTMALRGVTLQGEESIIGEIMAMPVLEMRYPVGTMTPGLRPGLF